MRRSRIISNLLSEYADRLNKSINLRGINQGEVLPMARLSEEEKEDVQPLLNVAAKVKVALSPVEASPEFREALRRNLLAAARERLAYCEEPAKPRWLRQHMPLVLIATASTVSAVLGVVGIIAIFHYRSRHQGAITT